MTQKLSEDELVQLLNDARQMVRVGATYRHYKGNDYRVVDLAILTEGDGVGVIYKALYGEHIVFVRPLQSWCEDAEHDGKVVTRFQKIDAA